MESQRAVKFFRIRLRNEAYPGDARLQAPVEQGSNDLRANPAFPVLWEDNEILDITVGNTIGDNAAHADSPAGLCIGRDREGETASYEMAEIFGFVFLLPPSPDLIEGSNLFFIPRMDELNNDIFCHKKSYPYYCLNDSLIPT
jgi:hypothetical protein